MKILNSKNGFTLIELLIVIAIIAVLAVAFLPTILGAPAKGRDTARIADLQKIQKVLIAGDLVGTTLPNTGFIDGTSFNSFLANFGGKVPSDPQTGNVFSGDNSNAGKYFYVKDPQNADPANLVKPGTYSFGLYSNVEIKSNANTTCAMGMRGVLTPPDAANTDQETWCYAVLTTK